jgi:hypothetical protein
MYYHLSDGLESRPHLLDTFIDLQAWLSVDSIGAEYPLKRQKL